MSGFPNLSNIAEYARTTLDNRVKNKKSVSELNAWVRVSSAVGAGLTLLSNPNFKLFAAAGEASIYGNGEKSGTLGTTWGGAAVYAESDTSGFRPKPSITSIEIDEGAGSLSRKASFTITCFTKGQLDTLCEYFLEPGYTIFLEWGWNVPDSLANYSTTLDVTTVANYQNFEKVNKARAASNGTYDNYLGYITGGGLGSSGDTYEIKVSCTGFTELPAYFMAADSSEESKSTTLKKTGKEFSTAKIAATTDLGKKRFMMAYNRLPSNKRTQRVKDLVDDTNVADAANFINVDETVKGKVNELTTGTTIFGISLNDEEANVGGSIIEFPSGTEIIKDDAFIKFSALMTIINTIGIEGFKIGDTIVKTQIDTSTTVCCAFKKIFSTDKTKLFIPNATAPKFDLAKAANSETDDGSSDTEITDCTVTSKTTKINFPAIGEISAGVATSNNKKVVIQNTTDTSINLLDKIQGQWGFLDDLYVGLDFAKGILETKNFSIKNALYQILNGMSSAAGGLWDFQIIPNENETELRVIDLNLTPSGKQLPYTFNLMGNDSIFIDASLDVDISGAKMNQIIGKRLGQIINGSQKDIDIEENQGLFTNKQDLVLKTIQRRAESPTKDDETGDEKTSKEVEAAKRKNMELFLNKVGFVPKPDKDDKFPFERDILEGTFIVAYNDQAIFEFFKTQNDASLEGLEAAEVGPIMPIKFTFTIHGVSGIKRGDKFKVLGLPKNYETTGFFQVTSVRHTITDMMWKTDIEGSFRQSK
jgi:hypothetical protein